MKPEDIDKIFKERLAGASPTPPADLWSRLQERMEAEEEKPVVLLTPEAEQKTVGKQRHMWVYSSVAATLSLLLAVGVVFYNIHSGTPEIHGTITKYDVQLPEEAPAQLEPAVMPAPSDDMIVQQAPASEMLPPAEKKQNAQATLNQHAASNLTKQPTEQRGIAKATPKAVQRTSPANAPATKVTTADAQTAIAANFTPDAPAVEAVPVTKPAAVASTDLNAEPVEIIIKRAVASQTALSAESEQPTGGSRKKALAKNIFKQVRNLASGDGVELEELGIRADRVALETQIGKQKISKVINL